MSQIPDLSHLHNDKEKIDSLLSYCETLRINQRGVAGNYPALLQVALKGLTFTRRDQYNERARFFFYAALGNYYQVKFDSAQYYFYESLHAAQQGKEPKQITKACVALIPVNFQLQQETKADECKNILQSIVDTTRDKNVLQDGYYALGSYYQFKSYYSSAQDYFIKSLELREKQVDTTNDPKKKFDYAIQCDMLSKLYLNTGMTDKSIDVLRQAARFMDVSPNVGNRLISSFVEAYTSAGNIDSALSYNKKLESRTKNDLAFSSEIMSSDLNIGIYYIDHKKYDQALPYINKSDTIANRVQSPLLLFQTEMIRGRWYEETGKYDQAIAVLSKSIPVAKQLNKELYANDLKYMALAQKGKGNMNVAMQYYEQYAEVTDSITKEKLSRNLADQETRYQTSQKEQRIVALGKQNQLDALELQNASRTRLLLVLGLGALGIITLLLYFIYRNKEKLNTVLNSQNEQLGKLNAQLAIANETKAKLFGIIGHDLRSPVGKIVQLLQLQKENPQALDEASRKRHEAQLKTASENVLETMEDLLLWSKSQMQHFEPVLSTVEITPLLHMEIGLLQDQLDDKKLSVDVQVSDALEKKTDENFITIIFRNLLQNAVKYGTENSVIQIAADGRQLSVSNESRTADAAAMNDRLTSNSVDSKNSGLGLQIARDLAVAIGANISFQQEKGDRIIAILQWP
ncbi:MAG: tetratricopeptide repeat-containing sensor histidine kinase [Bacteroidetes bacterium]|nr:tetratricopeptide repeat-containing sensor histidine kinase [Bacteroidota bacterium]